MTGHIDESLLNDYLDEISPAEDARTVEAHLAVCSECSNYLAELRLLVGEMGELPLDAEPSRDLWAGIHARIDGRNADVLEMPRVRGLSTGRRVSMSWVQLLAASVALAGVSGGVVWTALQVPSSSPSADGFVSPIAAVQTATTQFDEAILELEQVIEEGREVLTPETILALEQSLAAIDQAIAEARSALSTDPNSGLLNRLLANHQQAKLRVLHRAALAVQI